MWAAAHPGWPWSSTTPTASPSAPVPSAWVAEFGFYAPTVRKVTVIPGQVRDLRSLLIKYGDDHVAWVWLVADVAANHVNTYLPR